MISLGDSHVKMFDHISSSTCMVPGATAYGLSNLASSTGAFKSFTKFLNSHPNELALTCLGEVDCNALFFRKDLPLTRFIMVSVGRYIKFLNSFGRKFVVSSVVLPIVENYQSDKYLSRKKSPRSYVNASKEERSEMVYVYNCVLERSIETIGSYFLDITTPTMNAKGIIKDKYVKDPSDPHLALSEIKPIIDWKLHAAEGFCYNIQQKRYLDASCYH